MNQTYYNEKIGDNYFKVTEKYIQYGSNMIPTSSISYVSIKRPTVSWWIPTILLLSAIAVYSIQQNHIMNDLSIILFVIGIIALFVTIIRSQKRYLWIYSHSGQYIFVEKKRGDDQAITDAIYNLIEQNVSVVKSTINSDTSNTSISTDL